MSTNPSLADRLTTQRAPSRVRTQGVRPLHRTTTPVQARLAKGPLMADSFTLLADLIAVKDPAVLALTPHQALHACRCVGAIRADQWLRSMGVDTSMRLVTSTNRA